jgi:hypothetical protein
MAEITAFSSIRGLQRTELTEAIYQIFHALSHRKIVSRASKADLLDLIGFESSIDPKGGLRPYIEEALSEIEAAEKKGLQDIPEEDLSKYRQTLSKMLASRSKVGSSNQAVSGAELLARVS